MIADFLAKAAPYALAATAVIAGVRWLIESRKQRKLEQERVDKKLAPGEQP